MNPLVKALGCSTNYASLLKNNAPHMLSAAFALSIGIAIQNFPEGAIISMPLYSKGMGKNKAFLLGALSGIIEPIGALITVFAVSLVLPFLPSLLGFAAGAMIFAVLKELMPSIATKEGAILGTIFFAIGLFSIIVSLLSIGE